MVQVEQRLEPSGLVLPDGQRHLMRWILFYLFSAAFGISAAVDLTLLFLVGFGEVKLPEALLIPLGAATIGNVFPGLIYAIAFAFGRRHNLNRLSSFSLKCPLALACRLFLSVHPLLGSLGYALT